MNNVAQINEYKLGDSSYIYPTSPGTLILVNGSTGGTDIAIGETKTFDLSSYLPNDGYKYFVYATYMAQTNTNTVGYETYIKMVPSSEFGDFGDNNIGVIRVELNNKGNTLSGDILFPIGTDRQLSLKIGDNAKSGIYLSWLRLSGYKRIPNEVTSPISYIQKDEKLIIGGLYNPGRWTTKVQTVFSGTGTVGASQTNIDISGYVPEDGCDYEIIWDSYVNSSTTLGNTISMEIQGSTPQFQQVGYVRCNTANSSIDTSNNGSFILKSTSNRTLGLNWYGTSGDTSGTCKLEFKAYRRLGKNE